MRVRRRLAAWGFVARRHRARWLAESVCGWREGEGRARDRPIGVSGCFGGAAAREFGRRDRRERERSGAGEICRRRAKIGSGAGRICGHDESISAGSAEKLRGRAPRANVSMMRMRPPQQGKVLDEASVAAGSGSGAVVVSGRG